MALVTGKITITVEIEVDSNNEKEAIAQAKEELSDYYHLDVMGAYHDPDKEVKIELHAELD